MLSATLLAGGAEVIRCVLLCMLEAAVEGGLCLREVLKAMEVL